VLTVAADLRLGGGAVLGSPSRDSSDALLAKQLNLKHFDPSLNHPEIDLRPATRYRLRDSSISRQRSWGAPVPVIHCAKCGPVPVPDKDLPVLLPADLVPDGKGNALAAHPTFSDCVCPRCTRPAKRDTDTLDVHVDSIWMLIPFCVPQMARDEQMFTHPELQRWLPVSQVVCGVDQAAWWINDRLFFKVLKDCGYFQEIPEQEPVREILMHEMVLANGRKMSKSLGNVVDPEEVIRSYGADAVRLSVLRVSAHKAFSWTDEALEENYEFLSAIWMFVNDLVTESNYRDAPETDTKGQSARRKLARWCFTAESKVSRAYELKAFHTVLKELKNLFAMIRKFAVKRKGVFNLADLAEIKIATELFLNLLEPLAPHISYALSKEIKKREEVGKNTEVVGSDCRQEFAIQAA
jgi:leucyl-tRNA synthetase